MFSRRHIGGGEIGVLVWGVGGANPYEKPDGLGDPTPTENAFVNGSLFPLFIKGVGDFFGQCHRSRVNVDRELGSVGFNHVAE